MTRNIGSLSHKIVKTIVCIHGLLVCLTPKNSTRSPTRHLGSVTTMRANRAVKRFDVAKDTLYTSALSGVMVNVYKYTWVNKMIHKNKDLLNANECKFW